MIYPKVRNFEGMGDGTKYSLRERQTLHVSPDQRERVAAFVRASAMTVRVESDADLKGFSLRMGECVRFPEASAAAPLGYVIDVDAAGLALSAQDISGFYAGLQTLWQLMETGHAACGRIIDWPEVAVRSFQIDVGRQPETVTELKRLLRQQARYHFNECQVYLENSIKLDVFGDAADPEGLTKAEFQELVAYGYALGVEVVPSLNLAGHMEKLLRHPAFKHLSETREGPRHPDQPFETDLCLELPETRKFVAEIVREICEISPAKKLMVGLDECWTLGSCSLCRAKLDDEGSAGAIFSDYIGFLHAEVTSHGKQMWMWDDMLFYHKGSLERIPRDIGMNIWHYSPIEEYPAYSFQNWRRIDAVRECTERGHPIMLCGGDGIDNLMSLLRYAEGYPLEGMLVTQWEGTGIVQELRHSGRAFAASIPWRGEPGEPEDVAGALAGWDNGSAVQLGELLTMLACVPSSGGAGGAANIPRYWAWPGTAAAVRRQRELLKAFDRHTSLPEALEVQRAFLAASHIGLSVDCIREETALIGRAMVQNGLRKSACLDRQIELLTESVELAQSIEDRGRVFHQRYADGQNERPMVRRFSELPKAPAQLLEALRTFQAEPSPETWPYPAVTLCVDYLIVDRCAQRLRIAVSDDGESFDELYAGPARAASGASGHACQSFGLTSIPRFVQVEIGGFAALGLRHIRLETIGGTRLPKAVVGTSGAVTHPEYLLEFDEKVALFNEPDVMKNWLSRKPLPANVAVLGY
ncbi:MAG: beta-N-acetylhexosaminidase [Candidatus Pacebacteria bacterium]|nr:beta-N-acetylhexosaminidase [Candidatus Paceibacterota bacterium]